MSYHIEPAHKVAHRVRTCQGRLFPGGVGDKTGEAGRGNQAPRPIGESPPCFTPGNYWDAQGVAVAGASSLDLQKKTGILSALVAAGWPEVADKIRDCGRSAKKRRCLSCGAEWVAPDRCHHRICPDCAPIRASRLANAHERLTGQPNLKHLVLTFKNTPQLSADTIPWMQQCLTRLRHRKVFARAWRGGIYAFEFTYTKAKGWHPHIHALVDGDYIPQAVISKAWKEVTGSSDVVWIERARNSRQVLKYILKPGAELLGDPVALDNFLTVIHGRHLVSGWGRWHRVTERWLMGDDLCPFCGSENLETVGLVVWSHYYGRWVGRSPPAEECSAHENRIP